MARVCMHNELADKEANKINHNKNVERKKDTFKNLKEKTVKKKISS